MNNIEIKLTTNKITFSGHESFQCRHLWLKKGYDFVKSGRSFSDEDAVLLLGVGKNMVISIKFWMRAFGLIDAKDELTPIATKIFGDNGYDPYLEDEATIWILHYQLVKVGVSSIYTIIFNEFRREKIEFTKDNFLSYIKRRSESEKGITFNEKTISDDFTVLVKMYLRSETQTKDKEDSFSGLLTELALIKSFTRGKLDYYVIENSEKNEISEEIILFAILDQGGFDTSVNFSLLETQPNNIGSIFAINRPGLINKIQGIANKFPSVIFNDQAGVKEIQFKEKIDAFSVLDRYYGK